MSKNPFIIFFVFVLGFLISCGDAESGEGITVLPNITNLTVDDIANNNNGSDIEINFEKQTDLSLISEYRIILIKNSKASNFEIDQAENLASNLYTIAAPSDIIPVMGLILNVDTKDTDGDLIVENEEYRVGVLSVSVDLDLASNTLQVTNESFVLSNNNLLSNHGRIINFGGGSISIDANNNLYMGSYNVLDEFLDDAEDVFPVIRIGSTGISDEFSMPFDLLGGNDVSDDGLLYQAELKTGNLFKINIGGDVSDLKLTGYKLNSADGIFIDHEENIFVVDSKVNTIAKISPAGNSERFAMVSKQAKGICGDEFGNLYVSHNSEDGSITKISADGDVTNFANVPVKRPENYNLEFLQWLGYIEYHEENLYVASMSTDRVYKIDMTGNVIPFVGSGKRGIPRGGAMTADLNRPIGLAFSNDGRSLYISCSADNNPVHTQSSDPTSIYKVELVE